MYMYILLISRKLEILHDKDLVIKQNLRFDMIFKMIL